jgi:MraZ protein
MLTGEYRHAIDTKKRLFIPAKHREVLGNSFIIVRDLYDPCLKIYSIEEWKAFVAPIDEMDPDEAAPILRYLYRDSVSVDGDLDAQGRVTLNNTLIARAGITKDAVIVGCGRYAEIWAAEEYDAKMEEEDVAAIAASLRKLRREARGVKA